MLLRFEPIQAGDPRRVLVQDKQALEFPDTITDDALDSLAQHYGISGFLGDECIGCAGVIEHHTGRASGWALLSTACGPYMLEITRAVRQALDRHPARRIEIAVFADFPEAKRWARLLGFACETPEPMRFYAGERSAFLYSRCKAECSLQP